MSDRERLRSLSMVHGVLDDLQPREPRQSTSGEGVFVSRGDVEQGAVQYAARAESLRRDPRGDAAQAWVATSLFYPDDPDPIPDYLDDQPYMQEDS